MNRPTQRNYRSLLHYIWNTKALVRSETKLFDKVDDFVILVDEQDSVLHTFLEGLILRFTTNGFEVGLLFYAGGLALNGLSLICAHHSNSSQPKHNAKPPRTHTFIYYQRRGSTILCS